MSAGLPHALVHIWGGNKPIRRRGRRLQVGQKVSGAGLTDRAGGSGPAGGAATLEALSRFLAGGAVEAGAGQTGVVGWDTRRRRDRGWKTTFFFFTANY